MAFCAIWIAASGNYKTSFSPTFFDDKASKPMVILSDKESRYRLITREGQSVTTFIDSKDSEKFEEVYINHRSQFVFSNGESILFKGKAIFWNRLGDIMTYNMTKISKSEVLFVDEKEMPADKSFVLGVERGQLMRNLNTLRMEDIGFDPSEEVFKVSRSGKYVLL